MRFQNIVVVVTVICVLLISCSADACPTCKQAQSEHGFNAVRGFGLSIIFMMSMPFLVFGGISTMFYLDVRRARRMQAQELAAKGDSAPSTSPDSVPSMAFSGQ